MDVPPIVGPTSESTTGPHAPTVGPLTLGPLNVDHAGTFGLFLTSSTEIVHLRRTKPNVDVVEISSLEAKGPGCFILYKYPNYRGHISRVYGGNKNKTFVPVIKSVEYFLDCTNNSKSNRHNLGVALGVSAVMMIVVLLPKFKETYMLKTKATRTSEAEMQQAAVMHLHLKTGGTKTDINFTSLWNEIVNWRKSFQKRDSLKAILLGLLPSALDVSSDYSYARTWDEQGFNPQIRALIYFFICLPQAAILLTAMLDRVLNCSYGSKLGLRIFAKAMATFLFSSLLVGLIFGGLYLGWYHPDVFAYFAFASAVITVGCKAASVLVQGSEMKKAMILMNARKVDKCSFLKNELRIKTKFTGRPSSSQPSRLPSSSLASSGLL